MCAESRARHSQLSEMKIPLPDGSAFFPELSSSEPFKVAAVRFHLRTHFIKSPLLPLYEMGSTPNFVETP